MWEWGTLIILGAIVAWVALYYLLVYAAEHPEKFRRVIAGEMDE